nr:HAMP domain-containing sensor histidine kinase [Victivallales bacterium]
EIIHGLVAGEYEQAGLWQRQSLFFFSRLQYLLVTFFILTTLFIVLSSSYSGFLLKKYLSMLSEGTKEISSGNLKYRFGGIEPDEMGSLMADFNSMAGRLEKQTFELREINKKLEEKARQLIEANLHKDRFFANMSHELRTPLNSIIGFSELNIERKYYPKENLVENSKKILSAAEHLLDLISGLLDVAKADAGVLVPNPEEHDIAVTLNNVIEMLRPLAERKNLYLLLEKSESILFSYDDKMMRQIIINIVSNAIKFTHQGGIRLRLFSEEDSVLIEVEDSGIGISKNDQNKIFNDFHRVESGLTSNYEGVGLGLALSRRLVRLHGGEISLSSSPGKGSLFSVKLPLKKLPLK